MHHLTRPRSRSSLLLLSLLGMTSLLVFSSPAQAGLEACGDLHIEADANCVVEVETECKASCTPLSFQAVCALQGHAECDDSCQLSLEAECTSNCSGDCNADCALDPGSFDCSASCQSDCSANCSGSCEANTNQAQCEASCSASCSANCDAECTIVAPDAECSAQCEGSCTGSCTAEANLDCQISCQAELYADCESSFQGGCEVNCQQPEGALFCDGQYIDHGGKLKECIQALDAILDIKVDASASVDCEDGACQAEASLSCFSTVHPTRDHQTTFFGLMLGFGLLFGWTKRR